MSIKVTNKINDINCIIRTDEHEQTFLLSKNGEVNLNFKIYIESLDPNSKFDIKLLLIYSDQEDPKVADLKMSKVGEYTVDKNGFTRLENNSPDKTTTEIKLPKKKSNKIGLTDGFSSDLNLTLPNLKLIPGVYEMTALLDNKILSIFPFEIKKNED